MPLSPQPTQSWSEAQERFVAESNRIEGIHRPVIKAERDAHKKLWAQTVSLAITDVEEFVAVVAKAEMRDREGMDVRVGTYRPPRGHPRMRFMLRSVLECAQVESAYETHVSYEQLHPFMDGNGRSGRAIWAWQMLRSGRDPFTLGFLHTSYYQALDASRR